VFSRNFELKLGASAPKGLAEIRRTFFVFIVILKGDIPECRL